MLDSKFVSPPPHPDFTPSRFRFVSIREIRGSNFFAFPFVSFAYFVVPLFIGLIVS